MNYNVFPVFSRDHRDIPNWQTEDEHPVYAKDQKDVPDWLKAHHHWEPAFEVNKLQKHQLKVKMCCTKCEEIVIEKIREVRSVFDVRAERREKKVVVVAMPGGLDEHEVLRKARKVHRKARFVELDAKEKQKLKVDNKSKDKDKDKDGRGHGNNYDYDDHDNKGHGHGHGNQGGGQGKKGKEQQSNSAHSIAGVAQLPWGQPLWPILSIPPRYFYPPSQIDRYPDPHGHYVYFL